MIINVDSKLRGERGGACKKIMSTILEMIYLRFKAFESTVRKVSVLSFNCIFFGNSTIQCFIYIFSSAAPVQFPCLGSMFQLLLASIFNTYLSSLEQVSNALHWHFSYSYRLFLGGSGGRVGGF